MDENLANHSYGQLLRGGFKSLGYFIDEALASKDAHAFFCLIADSIVPLIRTGPAFESFYLGWIQEKDEYHKAYAKTEKAAIDEINSVFKAIKNEFHGLDPTENSSVISALCSIEDVLEFREVFAMPAHYEIVYTRITQLLRHLLANGQESFVKKYAEITSIDKSHIDTETKKVSIISESIVECFTFAPSLKKLTELNKVYAWDDFTYSWKIWDRLDLIYWCWLTPFSYFEDKKLEYGNAKECGNSGFLLNLHAFWIEMNEIKKRINPKDEKGLFFQRDRFTGYLKSIGNQVLLHQEIYGSSDIVPDLRSPFALELKLDFGKLLLKVEWFEGSKDEEYLIHKFNDESANYRYTEHLLSSKPNNPIYISDLASGATIPKYLSRLKIKDTLLPEIFFVKKSTNKMALRSTRVELSDLPSIDLVRLREQIKRFEPSEKRLLDISSPEV